MKYRPIAAAAALLIATGAIAQNTTTGTMTPGAAPDAMPAGAATPGMAAPEGGAPGMAAPDATMPAAGAAQGSPTTQDAMPPAGGQAPMSPGDQAGANPGMATPGAAPATYPTCSRSATDRCVQRAGRRR